MELREWAMRVFCADCLEEKLVAPIGGLQELTDHQPGAPMGWRQPPRAATLKIAPKHQRKKFPHPSSLDRQDMRVRSLHAFANHELMALEMMAWALLAFPAADKPFRKGLAKILLDEQRHFRLYAQRLAAMGVQFGELPLNDHFWRAGANIADPLDWICTMHLTFEQSNLDHAPYYAKRFREVDDFESSQLMQQIFEDEIHHVRFGSCWLKHYQPPDTPLFELFASHCTLTNPPSRAMGAEFQEQARRDAGLDDEFIRSLRAWQSVG
ncbi:DUF455 family protein [bacterium]|nr:DUF455 family protein [bacterium]